jgi:hypothetical protein
LSPEVARGEDQYEQDGPNHGNESIIVRGLETTEGGGA